MNPIDKIQPESFFAEFLLPLRHANAKKAVRYLKLGRETGSYWGPVVSRTGGLERLPSTSADGAAMLERLGSYWATQADPNLSKLLPYLVSLRTAIINPKGPEDVEEQQVSDFVYPMF